MPLRFSFLSSQFLNIGSSPHRSLSRRRDAPAPPESSLTCGKLFFNTHTPQVSPPNDDDGYNRQRPENCSGDIAKFENPKGLCMKKNSVIVSVIAAMLLFTGCASVSREDCLITDWYETGRLDGMQGLAKTVFQDRAKPCLQYGITVDRPAYYQGHDEGLTHYCTPQKGYELGVQGRTYNPICPALLSNDFLTGYQEGLASYCIPENGYELGRRGKAYRHICPVESEAGFRAGYNEGKAIYELEAKINRMRKELERLDRKIAQKEEELLSKGLSDKERTDIRSELRKLDREYRETARELNILELSISAVELF
jgi:hypothetical protein